LVVVVVFKTTTTTTIIIAIGPYILSTTQVKQKNIETTSKSRKMAIKTRFFISSLHGCKWLRFWPRLWTLQVP